MTSHRGFIRLAPVQGSQQVVAGLGHRADVEALRALAVSVVLIFHALPWALPGGFLGVDVFFVVSGHLIASL